jgi:hypothetical protein
MAGGAALRTMVGVGAHEQSSAAIVYHHLIKVRIGRAA